jgi:cysteine-rich repeat protein
MVPSCLDGAPILEPAEDGLLCDDGEEPEGDYCRAGRCVTPSCGDNVKGPTEPCDDGGFVAGDGCSPSVQLEECGNATPDPGEECDDGRNGDDADGCRDSCLFTCSTVELDCEVAAGDCVHARCEEGGFGRLCAYLPDPSDLPDDANPCTVEECNGMTPTTALAEDGTACGGDGDLSGRYCVSGVCRAPVCGDAIQGPLEGCDDGDQDPCDGCLPTCKLHASFCGDTFVCGEEECDDGNQKPGDKCSPLCTIEEIVGPCPHDMVLVPADPEGEPAAAYCMDRYEASRVDATAESAGIDNCLAMSLAGVLPWTAKPMTPAALATFQAACAAAGKRLCVKDEWARACRGSQGRVFVYGDTYDPEICNAVDTFCDDFCEANGIDPCVTTPNCGYTLSYAYPGADPPPMHMTLTGTMPRCTNELGHFDIVGNAWEIVSSDDDPRGYEVRGGAWNCASAAERHQCGFNAGWNDLWAGFRCCKEPEE